MDALFQAARVSRKWRALIRYTLATLLVALALLLSLTLGHHYFANAAFLCFLAIIVSGAFFGRVASIYATLLSATVIYFYLEPVGGLTLDDLRDIVALVLFLALGLGTGFLIEALVEAHDELAAAASQRQMLLDELSHRTRNDLAAIAGLLTLQAREVESEAAQSALKAAVGRINALARVHRRLAIHDGHAVVDSLEFLTRLCDDLRATLAGLRPITVRPSVESHPLALRRAVALGLVINELLTNALKYAFPCGREGEIVVEFRCLGDAYYLCVKDNGVGLCSGECKEGMGSNLVKMLVTQLGGEIETKDAKPGTLVAITFRK
jgi:two-component sensor histidine kinase